MSSDHTEERLLWLDAARGICALSVVLYHLLAWEYAINVPSAGMLSVYAFFILSALSLCLVYKEEFSEGIDRNKLVRFYVNRFARIMPLLFLVSSLYFLWFLNGGGSFWHGLTSYFVTSTGLFSLGAPGFISNTTGAWTVGVEIAFYIAFPVLFLLFGKLRISALIFAAVLLSAVQGAYAWHVNTSLDGGSAWPVYISLLSFSGFFAWGFVAYQVDRKRLYRGWVAYIAIILLTLFVWQSLIVDLSRVGIVSFPYSVVTGVFMGGCISVLYKTKNVKSLSYLKRNLGDISYSSYLLHPFVIKACAIVLPLGSIPAWINVLIVLSTTIILSKATFVVFENPARRFIRRRLG